MLKEAPENSFLRKLSTKQITEIGGLSDLDRIKKQLGNHVVIGDEVGLVLLMIRLSANAAAAGAVAFRNPTVYLESLSGFKMRGSLDIKRKKFVNKGY